MKILYACSDPSITPGSRGGGFTTHMEETVLSLRKLGHEVVVLDTKRPGGKGAPTKTAPAATIPREAVPPGSAPATPSHATAPPTIPLAESAQQGHPTGGIGGVLSIEQTRTQVPRGPRVLARDIFYFLYNLRFYFMIRSILRRRSDFDFIYERLYIYQFATAIAAKRWRLPLILEFNASIEEMNLNDGLGLRPVAAAIEKMVASRADAVLTVSGVLKNYLVGRGIDANKIHVMHNAANLDKFSPAVDGRAVRRKFGFTEDDVVVGFVGGFSVWHGAHLLLEAAPLAVEQNKNIRFLMVGGRQGHPRFEAFKTGVEEKHLSHMFRFAGEVPRERVPEHIAAADICVIPWATEYGSPTKTFEYMAMGKPLVAPAVAALKEVLEHDKTALFVETGNVEQIAQALVRLASEPALRQALGRNARKLAEQKYNWDANAAATLEIARNVIAGQGAAGGKSGE